MKFKVTSIILVFSLICNMIPLTVFAKHKGNPLYDNVNGEFYNKIISEFSLICDANPNAPISYVAKTKLKNDHREIRIYNMPYLVSDKSMINLLVKILTLCDEYKQKAIIIAEEDMTIRNNKYLKLIKPVLQSSQDVKDFADSLGFPLEQTINALIFETQFDEYRIRYSLLDSNCKNEPTLFKSCLLCWIISNLVSFSISKIIQHFWLFDNMNAKIGLKVLAVGLNLLYPYKLCHNEIKSKLERKKADNIVNIIRALINLIKSEDCSWRDNNVFIIAIDKTNCSSWGLHNLFRRNHGVWAGFENFSYLNNAPKIEIGDEYDEVLKRAQDIVRSVHEKTILNHSIWNH